MYMIMYNLKKKKKKEKKRKTMKGQITHWLWQADLQVKYMKHGNMFCSDFFYYSICVFVNQCEREDQIFFKQSIFYLLVDIVQDLIVFPLGGGDVGQGS